VAFQVFDIFQHKDGRAFGFNNPRDIEKERALRFAFKTMGATEGILLLTPAKLNGWHGNPANRTS
jgi:hypothetical protein